MKGIALAALFSIFLLAIAPLAGDELLRPSSQAAEPQPVFAAGAEFGSDYP